MPKMITSRAFRYQGNVLSKGAEFDPTDAEAKEFETKKYATRAVTAADKPQTGYKRRDMRAETAAEPAPQAKAQPASHQVSPMGTADFGGPTKE